nr:hypothetical protein PsAHV6-044 [Psittacid alphaherpesvirus 6]
MWGDTTGGAASTAAPLYPHLLQELLCEQTDMVSLETIGTAATIAVIVEMVHDDRIDQQVHLSPRYLAEPEHNEIEITETTG